MNTTPKTFKLKINNQGNLPANSKIYIFAVGINPVNPPTVDSGSQSYVKFDSNGVGSLIAVSSGSKSETYSSNLLDIPLTDGKHVLTIPEIGSGRLYFSLDYELDFPEVTTQVKQADSSFLPSYTVAFTDPWLNLNNPNYNLIYDKIEFSFLGSGKTKTGPAELYINTTSVDFFALPISLEGTSPGSSKVQKGGLTESRSAVIDLLRTNFENSSKLPGQISSPWPILLANYNDGTGDTVMRVVAPNKAVSRPSGNFDETYLDSFLKSFWEFYAESGNKIKITAIELPTAPDFVTPTTPITTDNCIFTGVTNKVGDTYNMTFTNNPPSPHSVTTIVLEGIPTSSEMFGCFANSGAFSYANKTIKSVMVKYLSTAINIGFANFMQSTPVTPVMDTAYFQTNLNKFYPKLTTGESGPWYNLYSKVLHSYGQSIYAFAFDDAAGESSTLHLIPEATTTNPMSVELTLHDMGLTKIPNPNPSKTYPTFTILSPSYPVIEYVNPSNSEKESLNTGANVKTNLISPFQIIYGGTTYLINAQTKSSALPGVVYGTDKVSLPGQNYPSVEVIKQTNGTTVQYRNDTGKWIDLTTGDNTIKNMPAPMSIRYKATKATVYNIDLVAKTVVPPLTGISYAQTGLGCTLPKILNPNSSKTYSTFTILSPSYPIIEFVNPSNSEKESLNAGANVKKNLISPFQIIYGGTTYSINAETKSSTLPGVVYSTGKVSLPGQNYPSVEVTIQTNGTTVQYRTDIGEWIDLTTGDNTIKNIPAPMSIRYKTSKTNVYNIDLVARTVVPPLAGASCDQTGLGCILPVAP